MRKYILMSLAGCLLLSACNNIKKPSKGNFTKAINSYLAKRGDVCVGVGNFPVDLTVQEQKMNLGSGPEMAALEQAGLLHSTNTVAAPRGLFGPGAPQPVKRYELTDEGKKYYKQIPRPFGQTGDFCYGQEAVDSIVKWTEPSTAGSISQTNVTYTYKVDNLAAWAQKPDVQKAFPLIPAILNNASKTEKIAPLQLTNEGWEVPAM